MNVLVKSKSIVQYNIMQNELTIITFYTLQCKCIKSTQNI